MCDQDSRHHAGCSRKQPTKLGFIAGMNSHAACLSRDPCRRIPWVRLRRGPAILAHGCSGCGASNALWSFQARLQVCELERRVHDSDAIQINWPSLIHSVPKTLPTPTDIPGSHGVSVTRRQEIKLILVTKMVNPAMVAGVGALEGEPRVQPVQRAPRQCGVHVQWRPGGRLCELIGGKAVQQHCADGSHQGAVRNEPRRSHPRPLSGDHCARNACVRA